jgi:homoserine O-acetyltransferase/O-succinyltransferase
MKHALLALALILLAGSPAALAAAAPATTEGDCTLHDFRFASGEALPELRLHYTTLGTPVRDAAGWCATPC